MRGISYDDIMLGISVLRNQHLANIFYRLRLIEAYGTGMLKIHECYADFDEKPRIEVSENAFKITLPNMNFRHSVQEETDQKKVSLVVPAEKRQEMVMRLFETQSAITRKDVETALNVSQATATLVIRRMVADGLLVKEGGGKHVQYRSNKDKQKI